MSCLTREAGDPTVCKESINIIVVFIVLNAVNYSIVMFVHSVILTVTFWVGELTENRRCLGNDSDWNVGVFSVHTATLIFGAELDRFRPLEAGKCEWSSVSISFAAITVLKDNI